MPLYRVIEHVQKEERTVVYPAGTRYTVLRRSEGGDWLELVPGQVLDLPEEAVRPITYDE